MSKTNNKAFRQLRTAREVKRNRKYRIPHHYGHDQRWLANKAATIIISVIVGVIAGAILTDYLITEYGDKIEKWESLAPAP